MVEAIDEPHQIKGLHVNLVDRVLLWGFAPEIQTCYHVLPTVIFISVQNLSAVSAWFCEEMSRQQQRTSLVLECNMRIFFPVIMCIKLLVSRCLISMKPGSNANRYGWLSAKQLGFPSQSIFQSGLARQPFLLTKNENSL